MRFLHFSDTHIDAFTFGPMNGDNLIHERVLDVLDMIDSMIEFAEAENIDLAIFSGDAFHRNNPGPLYLNEWTKRIIRLRRQCPVVLLTGNHDMARSDRPSSIDVFTSMGVEDVTVGRKYEVIIVNTKAGKVQVGLAPYPTKALLAPEQLRGKPEDMRKAVKATAESLIYEMGNSIDDSMPSILVGHFTVSTAKYSLKRGSERDMVTSDDADVSIGYLVDPVWDYVAMGHIHFHQCMSLPGETPVVYAGSIDRVNFGEEAEEKGFVYVEITDKTTWQFVPVDARPYKTVEVHIPADIDNPTSLVLKAIKKADLTSAMVRVSIHVPEELVARIDKQKIQHLLDNSGAFYISAINIMPIRSTVLRMAESKFNVSMTHLELLDVYLEEQGVGKRKALMKMAADIMGETNA